MEKFRIIAKAGLEAMKTSGSSPSTNDYRQNQKLANHDEPKKSTRGRLNLLDRLYLVVGCRQSDAFLRFFLREARIAIEYPP
jgi:hypothetical protein